jgi:protein-S-isoprenylcysteine O-methyltransferase Ste14
MSHRTQTQPMPPRIPPPILMLLAAGLMWVLAHWMPLAQWISAPWNRLGGLVAAVGIAIAVAAFARFRNAGTTVNPLDPSKASRLVTDGVFRVSRNPMYLGLVLLLIGWAVWLGSASPWLVPPLFVIVLTVVQIIPEEQALSRNFGESYLLYRRSVTRWIGRRR